METRKKARTVPVTVLTVAVIAFAKADVLASNQIRDNRTFSGGGQLNFWYDGRSAKESARSVGV